MIYINSPSPCHIIILQSSSSAMDLPSIRMVCQFFWHSNVFNYCLPTVDKVINKTAMEKFHEIISNDIGFIVYTVCNGHKYLNQSKTPNAYKLEPVDLCPRSVGSEWLHNQWST